MPGAFSVARRAVEKMYDSTMNVIVFDSDTDAVVTENVPEAEPKYTNEKCRVSQKTIGSTDSGTIAYETKLFCSPELNIPAGSRVIVTDIHGNKDTYVRSGDPFDSYVTHQEITLKKEGHA